MSELMNREASGMTVLDGLAMEARIYSEGIAMNMLQLGRVFTEAKKLVKHGQWGQWLRQNSGVSERGAQQFMQAYARFGKNATYAHIEKSKLFKMLSLPADAEEQFAAEHDVATMTSREIEAAVRKARERAGDDLDDAKQPAFPDNITETLREKDAVRQGPFSHSD